MYISLVVAGATMRSIAGRRTAATASQAIATTMWASE